MKKLFLILTIVFTISGCSSVKDKKVTEANKNTIIEEIKDTRDLSVEEVGLLQGYLARHNSATDPHSSLGSQSGYPVGKTIAEIIDEEKAFQLSDKKNEQAKENQATENRQEQESTTQELEKGTRQNELSDILSITVTEKGFLLRDDSRGRHSDYLLLKTNFGNNSDKGIRACRGEIEFRSLFDEPIMSAALNEVKIIPPGQSRTHVLNIAFDPQNPGHVKLKESRLEDLKVGWQPDTILFMDGSKLTAHDR